MRLASVNEVGVVNEVEVKSKPVILIGFMGSGKSTIGRQVAQLCGREFIDLDKQVAEKSGLSIPQLFAEKGEDYFRQLEHEELQRCLERPSSLLATGGGIVLREANRRLMQERGWVIHLQTTPEVVYERVKTDDSRPLILDENGQVSYELIKRQWQERQPYYAWTPWEVVNGPRETLEVVADVVGLIRMLHRFQPSS